MSFLRILSAIASFVVGTLVLGTSEVQSQACPNGYCPCPAGMLFIDGICQCAPGTLLVDGICVPG